MNKYDSCQDELVMFSYLSGTVFVTSACLYTGDFVEGVRFIRRQVGVVEWLLVATQSWLNMLPTFGGESLPSREFRLEAVHGLRAGDEILGFTPSRIV